MRYMERRIHGSKRYKKDGDPYLLYGKDQTPAECGARQENKETEHLQKTHIVPTMQTGKLCPPQYGEWNLR